MIFDLQTAPKVPFDLDGRIMYSSSKAQLVHLTLQQGESIGLHSNPFDVVFYILEGEGELKTEKDLYKLSANQSIHIEADLQRGIMNNGPGKLCVLVLKIF
jgi:quercetin dioxygenase-like cupin family protein